MRQGLPGAALVARREMLGFCTFLPIFKLRHRHLGARNVRISMGIGAGRHLASNTARQYTSKADMAYTTGRRMQSQSRETSAEKEPRSRHDARRPLTAPQALSHTVPQPEARRIQQLAAHENPPYLLSCATVRRVWLWPCRIENTVGARGERGV